MENTKNKNQIRAERERAGLTLEKLAEKSGIPTTTLFRYQDSDHVPLEALQKIADALRLPVSALTSKREIPESERLTYDQVYLQLQATQQHNIYLAMICDRLNETKDLLKQKTKLLRVIAIILALFLVYIMIDRFVFPNAGLFHQG